MFNIMQLAKGKVRWSMIADNIWDMILGKAGKLPGEVDEVIKALANEQGREFYIGDPQALYPDKLNEFKKEMAEKGWDSGKDDEELFELAMHPEQYRAFKSGKAKADFIAELEHAQSKKEKAIVENALKCQPDSVQVEVNGEKYIVNISYNEEDTSKQGEQKTVAPAGKTQEIIAPLEGKFYLTNSSTETPKKVGDDVALGDLLCYIESMKTYNAITADKEGKIIEICFANSDAVFEDDVLFKLG